MKIGALYVRVSTHNQDELSPDAQIRLGKEFAEKNNITIPEEYIFMESVSGRKAEKRHDFQRMIGLAKTKPRPFSVIIVWSIVVLPAIRKNPSSINHCFADSAGLMS